MFNNKVDQMQNGIRYNYIIFESQLLTLKKQFFFKQTVISVSLLDSSVCKFEKLTAPVSVLCTQPTNFSYKILALAS